MGTKKGKTISLISAHRIGLARGGADAPPSGPGRGFGAAAPEAKEQLSTLPCCATRVTPSNGPFLGAWIDAKFGLLLCWYDSPFLGAWGDAKFGLSLCCAARHVAVARRSESCSTTVQFSGAWSDADMRWVSHCLDSNPRPGSLESEKKPTELTELLASDKQPNIYKVWFLVGN